MNDNVYKNKFKLNRKGGLILNFVYIFIFNYE